MRDFNEPIQSLVAIGWSDVWVGGIEVDEVEGV